MSGFMAGFGQAFSQGFNQQMQRRAQEKQDAFRFTFQEYLDKKKETQALEAEGAKAANKAKSFVETMGLPKEAYPVVYNLVASGRSDNDIKETLATGKFQFNKPVEGPDEAAKVSPVSAQTDAALGTTPAATPAPVNPAAPDLSVGPNVPAVGNQPASAPAPEMEAPVDTGNPITKIFSNIKNGAPNREEIRDKRRSEAIDKVAKATGRPRKEVERIMMADNTSIPQMDTSGVTFVPGELPKKADPLATMDQAVNELVELENSYKENPTVQTERELQRAQRRVEALKKSAIIQAEIKGETPRGLADVFRNGKWTTTTVIPMGDGTFVDKYDQSVYDQKEVDFWDKGRLDLEKDIAKSVEPKLTIISQRKNGLAAALTSAESMARTVDHYGPDILSPRAADIYQGASGIFADIKTFMNGFDQAKSGEELDPTGPEQLAQWKSELESQPITSEIERIATGKALLEIDRAIFGYNLGAAYGQDGRALQEKERILFTGLGTSGNTPERFYMGLQQLMNNAVKSLDRDGSTILTGDSFYQIYKSKYPNGEPGLTGYTPILEDLENGDDPEMVQFWTKLQQYDPRKGEKFDPTGQAQQAGGYLVVRSAEERARLIQEGKLTNNSYYVDKNGNIIGPITVTNRNTR